jgi:hypothetical protein
MSKRDVDVPEFMRSVTVKQMIDDVSLKKRVEEYLASIDYELVFPPDTPRVGDHYLGKGISWHPVGPNSYSTDPFCERSFVVRRPTEHKRMLWFFMGKGG